MKNKINFLQTQVATIQLTKRGKRPPGDPPQIRILDTNIHRNQLPLKEVKNKLAIQSNHPVNQPAIQLIP